MSFVNQAKSDESFPEPCAVCGLTKPLHTEKLFSAIAQPCMHVYCYECAASREFHGDQLDCPICEKEVKKILVVRGQPEAGADAARLVRQLDSERSTQYFVYRLWFDSSRKADDEMFEQDYSNKKKNKINPNVIEKELRNLSFFSCSGCSDASLERNLKVLEYDQDSYSYISHHLEDKHERYLCRLCFFNLKPFSIIQAQVTEPELLLHMQTGTDHAPGYGPVAHFKCELCKPNGDKFMPAWMSQWHWDRDALVAHLAEMHVRCDLCAKYLPDQVQFEHHLELSHFVCPECPFDGDERHVCASVAELMDHGGLVHAGVKIDYEAIVGKHLLASSQAKAAKVVSQAVPEVVAPVEPSQPPREAFSEKFSFDYESGEFDCFLDDDEGGFVPGEEPSLPRSQPQGGAAQVRQVETHFRSLAISQQPEASPASAPTAAPNSVPTAAPAKKSWANLVGGPKVANDVSAYPTLGRAADRSSITNRSIVTGSGGAAWASNKTNNNLNNWQQGGDGNNNRGFANGNNLANGSNGTGGSGGNNSTGNTSRNGNEGANLPRRINWAQQERSDASGFKGRGRGKGHK